MRRKRQKTFWVIRFRFKIEQSLKNRLKQTLIGRHTCVKIYPNLNNRKQGKFEYIQFCKKEFQITEQEYQNFINDLTKLVSSQTLAHVQLRVCLKY